LSYLPAPATSVAAYLLDRFMQGEVTAAQAHEIARGIEFCHDQSAHYLDRLPITAALKRIDDIEAAADSGGGKSKLKVAAPAPEQGERVLLHKGAIE
jgi:hypothetical protein